MTWSGDAVWAIEEAEGVDTKDFEQIRRGTIAQIRQSVIDEPPREIGRAHV